MRTIGLIGGMSWESSAEYYRIINQEVGKRLGPPHSAKIVMDSFDFDEVETMQREGRWDDATQMMVHSAVKLEDSGADFIVICTNTMHKMAETVQNAIHIPVLHIVDPTAASVQAQGIKKVGLLGTRFSMEEDFIKGRLEKRFDLEVYIPDGAERTIVHNIIYQELVNGIINPSSKTAYQNIIRQLIQKGAQGIILGCTEIGLLIKEGDSPVPIFDTTMLHALAAVDMALKS